MNREKGRADDTVVAKTAKNEALPAISSTTGGLPSAPSPTDAAAWRVPATREDCQAAATHLITATEMGLRKGQRASDDEKVAFIRLLASYDYTRAELIQAMREVPRDPERFGGRGATVQDVERIVKRSREMRTRLKQDLDEKKKNELLAAYPSDLTSKDFHRCGYNSFDEPLYRYAPDLESRRLVPSPRRRPARLDAIKTVPALKPGDAAALLGSGSTRREAMARLKRKRLVAHIATGRFQIEAEGERRPALAPLEL